MAPLLIASLGLLVLGRASSSVDVKRSASGKLNVHLVCHTHDDAGWLKTVDQYYYGANNTIAHAGVQYILDSVVAALEDDPSRKFVYAEQAFMWRWWRHQGAQKRDVVRRLVKDGQLSFINGGWVMHDEAAAHYIGMVDQTHLGHTFLRREFGEDALPTVAWQIDPFGHSATQASLLGAQAGFEALYFGRIDYQDKEKRIAESDMEMIWRSSRSLEENAQIFTGVFHSGNYGPPVGFCFDEACQDEPMMTDPLMSDYNVERRAGDFINACEELGRHTRGDDIMLQMGGDFGFENANAWFKNLDVLMKAVNQEGRVNVFYSTPEQYTRAKHASGLEWGIKMDDFFPYADCPNCYWTGYFTSRPGLKRLERVTSAYLQAARQLHAFTWTTSSRDTRDESCQALAALERAQALIQHHDGVTGTSKQHVAEDYAQRLDRARVSAEKAVSLALSNLAFGTTSGSDQGGGVGWGEGDGPAPGPVLEQCRFSNASICDVTAEATHGFVAVAYNPLAHHRSSFLDIPLPWTDISRVTDADGKPVDWQITKSNHYFGSDARPGKGAEAYGSLERRNSKKSPYTLVLPVTAPSLGIQVLHVTRDGMSDDARNSASGEMRVTAAELSTWTRGENRGGREVSLDERFDDDTKAAEGGYHIRGDHVANGISELTEGGPRELLGLMSDRQQHQDDVKEEVEVKQGNTVAGGMKARRAGGPGGEETRRRVGTDGEDISISNGLITLEFNGKTGRLARVVQENVSDSSPDGSRVGSTALDVDQGWFFYPTFDKSAAHAPADFNHLRTAGASATSAGSAAATSEQGMSSGSRTAGVKPSVLHQELPERLRASEDQRGGAYIFRPEQSDGKPQPVGGGGKGADAGGEREQGDSGLAVKEWWVAADGPLVWEVHQVFANWVTQTIRLRRGETHAELDWSVGPIPVGVSPADSSEYYGQEDGAAGKEVVSRFSAPSLASDGVFFTDANGREFQERVRDRRPTWDLNVTQPVAGNYYPVTAAAFVRDENGGADGMQLTVLTDRAQACSSLEDGQLEFLAHRRLLTNDQRGVGEALNETDGSMSHYPEWKRKGKGEVFRGTHYLVVSKKRNAMKTVRALMDEVFSPFVAGFAAKEHESGGEETALGRGTGRPSSEHKTRAVATNMDLFETARDIEEVPSILDAGEKTPKQSLNPGTAVSRSLVRNLPENVALMTLMAEGDSDGWDVGRCIAEGTDAGDDLILLVRFAHRFSVGEDPILSLPATIQLSNLVPAFALLSMEELSLTGGAAVAARAQTLKWSTTRDEEKGRASNWSTGTTDGRQSDSDVSRDVDSRDPHNGRGMLHSGGAGDASGVRLRGDVSADVEVYPRPWLAEGEEIGSMDSVEFVIGPMEIKTFRLKYTRRSSVVV